MRNSFPAAVACAALFGCAGHRPTGPDSKEKAVSLSDSSLSGPRDSANTLEAHFRGLDSTRVPEQFASKLYLLTLENFLTMAPNDPRVPEVRMWKANQLYNQRDYALAVEAYQDLIKRYPRSPMAGEANQMIAQAFERQGEHTKAENWYRRMLTDSNAAVRHEAEERIAQAIYLQGEAREKAGKFPAASEAYGRVSKEFPKADIAPISLFNAGVMAERAKDWPAAIGYYTRFFDLYYAAPVLPKVLFREAKCREMNGEFKTAGEKYRNLARTHTQSQEAELALYNAGFAFASAKDTLEAARAFEEYAARHPDKPEAPNLLSRAVESYGALRAWDKVADLQGQFARRYGGSKARLVQALSMGGLAEIHQGNDAEARKLMQKALAEFAQIKSPDANARYYAAQARQALGDLEAGRMRASPLRSTSLAADLKAKRALLRAAVEQYLGAMEMKIVDGVIHAGLSMAEAFRAYGEHASGALLRPGAMPEERLAGEEEALAELLSAYSEGGQQYSRVLLVARKQNINNRQVEDARTGIQATMASVLRGLVSLDAALDAAFPFKQGSVEEALSLRLTRAQRSFQAGQKMLEWLGPICGQSAELGLDSTTADSVKTAMLNRFRLQGKMFQGVADTARAAPIPVVYDSIQAFFYQAKLTQELLPSIEARAGDIFTAGIRFAAKNGMDRRPEADSIRFQLGQSLFSRAHALDFLVDRALRRPPIPADMPPAQRKPYEKKFEEMGYGLQESAVNAHRALVESAGKGFAAEDWAARSYAVLLRVEPDRWQTRGADTIFTLALGSQWPLVRDSTQPGKIRYATDLPWTVDPDSVGIEADLPGAFRVLIGGDTLGTFRGDSGSTRVQVKKTLTPRAGNLPPLDWTQGKRVVVIVKAAPGSASNEPILRLRVFGPAGPNQIQFPWNKKPVSEAELETLRNRPFIAPNFGS